LLESFYVSIMLREEYNPVGRVAVAIVFLLAAGWVLLRNHRVLRTTVSEGLRAPIKELTSR
jgi:uncharacterized membrane protein